MNIKKVFSDQKQVSERYIHVTDDEIEHLLLILLIKRFTKKSYTRLRKKKICFGEILKKKKRR